MRIVVYYSKGRLCASIHRRGDGLRFNNRRSIHRHGDNNIRHKRGDKHPYIDGGGHISSSTHL